jgi:hypothetical protein
MEKLSEKLTRMQNNEWQEAQEDEFDSDLEVGDQFMAVKPWLGAIKKP